MARVTDSIQYYKAQEKAYEVLVKYGDGKLPIDPFKIIKKITNIKLMTYSEFAKELQKKSPSLSIEEIKQTFESERGFLKKKGKKKYILAYNETDPLHVIYWTLFHELGHYFLKHLFENETAFCDAKTLKMNFEKEANCFARHCSSPMPIIKKIIETTGYEDRVHLFHILFKMGDTSTKYSVKHFNDFSEWYNDYSHIDLIKKYNNEIQEWIEFIFDFLIN